MRIPKRMALAVSGAAFAGATALAMGAATPAGAQTVTGAPQQVTTGHVTTHLISDGWGWDDDFGWDGGWDFGGDWC
jgi:hypothetical protein